MGLNFRLKSLSKHRHAIEWCYLLKVFNAVTVDIFLPPRLIIHLSAYQRTGAQKYSDKNILKSQLHKTLPRWHMPSTSGGIKPVTGDFFRAVPALFNICIFLPPGVIFIRKYFSPATIPPPPSPPRLANRIYLCCHELRSTLGPLIYADFQELTPVSHRRLGHWSPIFTSVI